jgi:uncharacterized protein (DUF2252 family)
VPRSAHADWTPDSARPDPIDVLEASNATRLPALVPIRFGRMVESPFAFFRGSAGLMALDLAATPVSGLRVQACGDAHVSNFGEFATPGRTLVFDVNDFDETLPGPWEWDLKRLATSLDLVVRLHTRSVAVRSQVVETAVRAYRQRMARSARMRVLDLWASRIEVGDVLGHFPSRYRRGIVRNVERARRRTHVEAAARLTRLEGGRREFMEDPPLLVRLANTEHHPEEALAVFAGYRESLRDDRRELLDRFRLLDVARKTVGVGSVGTRCWVALFEGRRHGAGDPLVLQIKEAGPSVLEPFAGGASQSNHGQRVVAGQRRTQAASDIFLGWSVGPESGRHYYVRQLWNMKGKGDPTLLDPASLARQGSLCAWALAHAHARTGDPVAIAGYIGRGSRFDRAIVEFAARYGDQVERDHAALVDAVSSGRVEARPGV